MKKPFLFIAISLFACNALNAQMLKTESNFVDGEFRREYRYLVDSYGKFDKMYGVQECHYSNFGLFSDYEIEYKNGSPVAFSFVGDVPFPDGSGEKLELRSEGKCDKNGIKILSSYYSGYNGGLKRALSVCRDGSEILFVGKMRADSEGLIITSYGSIYGDKRFIVNSYKSGADKGAFLDNCIILGSVLVCFADSDQLSNFITSSADCQNASDMKKLGYGISDETSSYSKYLKSDDQGSFMGSTMLPRWDYYSGFTNCASQFRIPSRYIYLPIGTGSDGELHYGGLVYNVIPHIKKVYKFKQYGKPNSSDSEFLFSLIAKIGEVGGDIFEQFTLVDDASRNGNYRSFLPASTKACEETLR